jgi:Condensation domain
MFEDTIQGFRLSTQQSRLWMLEQEAAVYRAQMAVRIAGNIDCERLERVVEALVARHDIFRTTFRRLPRMKRPLQVVADRLKPAWHGLTSEALRPR